MEESYFLRIWAGTVTLTLKKETKPFHMTLRVMMMHHQTKFYEERLSGSEYTVCPIIPEGFEPSLWQWLKIATQTCHKTLQLKIN